MNKKLLKSIACASLAALLCGASAFAAPMAHLGADSAFEVPVIVEEQTGGFEMSADETDAFMQSKVALTADSAYVTNTEFDKPQMLEDASLYSELAGEGTKESPYLISSAADLTLFADNINNGINTNAYYKLTSNIDLEGAEWTPIGHVPNTKDYTKLFAGVFDGDGYTVSNFKITKDKVYHMGLFCYLYGGTIKNLNVDNVTINVSSNTEQNIYAGIIAGRVVSNETGAHSFVENCNVTNSSIYVKNNGSLYLGGITGSVITGEHSDAYASVSFCKADCDITAVSNAQSLKKTEKDTYEPHLVTAGGITGYFSSQAVSKVVMMDCSASGDISVDTTGTSAADVVFSFAGGVIADFLIDGTGCSATVKGCSSSGNVDTKAKGITYGGGFAGQAVISKLTTISDCYSSSDISGESTMCEILDREPFLGGFFGLTQLPNYTLSMGKKVFNCYASGDITATGEYPDLVPNKNNDYTSYVGGFVGFAYQGIFQNCFKLESQTVDGACISNYAENKKLTSQQAADKNSYTGFDFDKDWDMDTLPVLKEKKGYATFYNGTSVVDVKDFVNNGKISAPAETPSKTNTEQYQYVFSHWSTAENGAIFDFVNTPLTQNISLYAVFTVETRKYTLKFINDGSDYSAPQAIDYGSRIHAPLIDPEKAETPAFFYRFLHWSKEPDGQPFDFDAAVMSGDLTLYAVYEEIDKSAWKGEVADSFASGYGTEALPYIISSAEEFALFAKVINEGSVEHMTAYYKLDANINLGGNYWVAIGNSVTPFSGHFDGNGYTIRNFKLTAAQYTGLFGYIKNGTVKNFYLTDFSIDFDCEIIIDSSNSNKDSGNVYIGAVAGYVVSTNRGKAELSNIRVNANVIDVNSTTALSKRTYLGSLVGYANATSGGRTDIYDCFATNDVSLVTDTGYGYVGGLAGRLDTGSGSLTYMQHCYFVGSVSSKSRNSSHVGGLVGHLFSYGSAYSPVPDDDETAQQDTTGDLAASDTDIMLVDCFAIADVSSQSTRYNSNVGRLVGTMNQFADTENIFYSLGKGSATPEKNDSKIGVATVHNNLKSESYLSTYLNFDFDKTWTFINGYDYPVLRSMITDKPALRLVSVSESGGVVSADIMVKTSVDSYTVIAGVYNARNQLIAVQRFALKGDDDIVSFVAEFSNAAAAKVIKLSAYDNASLAPIFEAVEEKI